jgi:2-polyprenyl-6-methoxyphenol hydroxylase-like FAD-dependent oxidoreductase
MKYEVWEDIFHQGVREYSSIVTWDDTDKNDVIFNSSSISYDHLGYVVSESSILNSLRRKVETNKLIYTIDPKNINRISENNNNFFDIYIKQKILKNVELIVKTNNLINNILPTTKQEKREIDYNHDALVLNIMVDKEVPDIAYQKFSNNQIQGLLPISDNQYNLIWSGEKNIIKDVSGFHDTELIKVLNNSLASRIGNIRKIKNKLIFPLKGFHLNSYYQGHIVSLGGAAHSVHPMAGLGLNMGLQDIFLLMKNIELHKNTINKKFLSSFEYDCMKLNNRTYNTINFLKSFYTDDICPQKFKVLSLKIFNNMGFIKNKIIEHATGINTLKKNSKEKYSYANN